MDTELITNSIDSKLIVNNMESRLTTITDFISAASEPNNQTKGMVTQLGMALRVSIAQAHSLCLDEFGPIRMLILTKNLAFQLT